MSGNERFGRIQWERAQKERGDKYPVYSAYITSISRLHLPPLKLPCQSKPIGTFMN